LSFVLDASVALSWVFEDEVSTYAEAVLQRLRDERAIVPWIWPIEVINALVMAERRDRLTQVQVDGQAEVIRSLPIDVDSRRPADARLIELCRQHQRTAYDALYLDLSMREGLPIATLDGGLRQACIEAGVELVRNQPTN